MTLPRVSTFEQGPLANIYLHCWKDTLKGRTFSWFVKKEQGYGFAKPQIFSDVSMVALVNLNYGVTLQSCISVNFQQIILKLEPSSRNSLRSLRFEETAEIQARQL